MLIGLGSDLNKKMFFSFIALETKKEKMPNLPKIFVIFRKQKKCFDKTTLAGGNVNWVKWVFLIDNKDLLMTQYTRDSPSAWINNNGW